MGEHGWKLLTTSGDGERIMGSLLSGGTVFLVRPSNPDHLTTFTGGEKDGFREMKHFHLIRISTAEVGSLSPREKEVLELLTSGFPYLEVGRKLDIGFETVRTHVKNICSKMRVRNRVEAVAKYMQQTVETSPSEQTETGPITGFRGPTVKSGNL